MNPLVACILVTAALLSMGYVAASLNKAWGMVVMFGLVGLWAIALIIITIMGLSGAFH